MRKRGEWSGGDDNLFRLCECSDLVFQPEEIDACLPSDGCVGLCKQGGGDIDAADAALECGGREPSEVADHPSADTYEQRATGGSPFGKLSPYIAKGLYAFAFLSGCHCNHAYIITFNKLLQFGQDGALNIGVGYQKGLVRT